MRDTVSVLWALGEELPCDGQPYRDSTALAAGLKEFRYGHLVRT
jgi:hypothetical protein